MYPNLHFGINKELDKKICLKFLNRKKAGIDFGAGIVKVHPELSDTNTLNEAQKYLRISEYFDAYYVRNSKELEQTRDTSLEDWKSIEAKFFEACDKYFNKHPWPVGEYIGFLSIINCNPRFLEDKSFQVYWKHKKGFVSVAVHEMLHFLFYELFSKLYHHENIGNYKVWQLSEVLNILLLSETEFVDVTSDSEPGQYPELLETQDKLLPVWKETKNVRQFVMQCWPKLAQVENRN